MARLKSHFLHPLSHLLQRWQECQTVLVAATEMPLLTGLPASTGGCQRCLCWQDRQTVLVAATEITLLAGLPDSTGGCHRDVSADRTARQYWWLPQRCLYWQDRQTVLVAATEMPLLTGLPASTGGCQRCLCWQDAMGDKLGVSLHQCHHTIVHIAYHQGMNNRPV
jgi:hypothetical protein